SNALRVLGRDARFRRKLLPTPYGRVDLLQHSFGPRRLDGGGIRERKQMIYCETVALAVDAHLMPARPGSRRVVGICDVEGGREPPTALLIHEKRYVLDVIVVIACDHIEDRATELLLGIVHRQAEPTDDLQRLL